MITNNFSFPDLNTSGDKMENKAKIEIKAKVDNKTHAKRAMIKGEPYVMPIHTYDVKVKVKENNQVKVESLFPGAKSNSTNILTETERFQLEKHQMEKRIFNSEVSLVSDWLVEHRPKNLATKDTSAEKTYTHVCVSRRPGIRTGWTYCASQGRRVYH
jgi:hypothetical protein